MNTFLWWKILLQIKKLKLIPLNYFKHLAERRSLNMKIHITRKKLTIHQKRKKKEAHDFKKVLKEYVNSILKKYIF